MTLIELLRKHDIKELWYILSKLHPFPAIRAEHTYKSYLAALNEILDLSPSVQHPKGVLLCELYPEEMDGGAPEVRFSCSLLEDSEYYGFWLREWSGLLLCEVDSSCIEKYGTLVVAAELLWELTFGGYTQEDIQQKNKAVHDIYDDCMNRYCKEIEDHPEKAVYWSDVLEEEENDEKNQIGEEEIKNWFLQASDEVKREFIEHIKAELFGMDKIDSISNEYLLCFLISKIDSSGYKYKDCCSATGIACRLVRNLDYNELLYLLVDVWGIE